MTPDEVVGSEAGVRTRFTVAGASGRSRRDDVARRAMRYSATRRVVIAASGVSAQEGEQRATALLVVLNRPLALGALLGQELLDHRT